MGKELTEKQKAVIKEVQGFTERCIQSAKIIHTGGYVPPFVELKRMEIDKMQTLARVMAIQLSPSKPFATGGIVKADAGEEFSPFVSSGECVIPMSPEQRRSQIADINIFPEDGEYHCINPVRGYEDE